MNLRERNIPARRMGLRPIRLIDRSILKEILRKYKKHDKLKRMGKPKRIINIHIFLTRLSSILVNIPILRDNRYVANEMVLRIV